MLFRKPTLRGTKGPRKGTGREVVVHIGGRKTGSTTLQAIMKQNREVLLDHGIEQPQGRRPDPNNPEDFAICRYFRGDEEYRDMVVAQADLFRNPASDAAKTVVISSEAFTDLTEAQLKSFRDWLSEFFSDVTIVFYVRRQDIAGASYYSTYLRHGGTSSTPISEQMGPRGSWPFKYGSIVRLWKSVFPDATIHIRRFVERFEDRDWTVTRDFFDLIGVDFGSLEAAQSIHNAAASADALSYLLTINRLAERGDLPQSRRFRQILAKRLDTMFADGPRVRPSRADAMKFYGSFSAENELLRKLSFPERDSVFSDAFDMYPEQEDAFLEKVDPGLLQELVLDAMAKFLPNTIEACRERSASFEDI